MISHELHMVMSATDQVFCLNRHICCSGHPDMVRVDPNYVALFGNTPVLTPMFIKACKPIIVPMP